MLEFNMKENISTVKFVNSDGTVQTKTVATQDLCSVFTKQVRKSSIVVPPGCRQIIEDGNKVSYVIITPPFIGQCALRWTDDDQARYKAPDNTKLPPELKGVYSESRVRVFKVPFPASAVVVQLVRSSEGKLNFRNIFAFAIVDHNVPYANMIAAHWPFTNMYSDCRVCIGSVPGQITNIDEVGAYPRYLYSGLGNHDLDSHFRINHESTLELSASETPYQFIKNLHGSPSMPREILKQIGPLDATIAATLGNYK